MTAVALAVIASLAGATPAPPPVVDPDAQRAALCPNYFQPPDRPVCYGSGGDKYPHCGGSPQHNLAYALRVGHLDWDPASNLLFNPGTSGTDHTKWDYFETPKDNDWESWCSEDYQPGKAGAPPKKPVCPTPRRCPDGSDGGAPHLTPACCELQSGRGSGGGAGGPPGGGGAPSATSSPGGGNTPPAPIPDPTAQRAVDDLRTSRPDLFNADGTVANWHNFDQAVMSFLVSSTGYPPNAVRAYWQSSPVRRNTRLRSKRGKSRSR